MSTEPLMLDIRGFDHAWVMLDFGGFAFGQDFAVFQHQNSITQAHDRCWIFGVWM